jgi:hypothetical protein
MRITPTDQSIDFPSSSPLVTGGGSTDGVSNLHFLKFSSCSTFVVHCLTTLPHLQRPSTQKNKKPSLFSVTVDIVLG